MNLCFITTSGRQYYLLNIDYENLTHVSYNFAKINVLTQVDNHNTRPTFS